MWWTLVATVASDPFHLGPQHEPIHLFSDGDVPAWWLTPVDKRKLEIEGIDRFAKTILIPVCVLLFLSLIFIVWRQVKQDRIMRRYQIMIMALLPHFDFDERREEQKRNEKKKKKEEKKKDEKSDSE